MKCNVCLKTVPPNSQVILDRLYPCKKADLSMGYWNTERKLGVAGHFFRDILSNVWRFFFPN